MRSPHMRSSPRWWGGVLTLVFLCACGGLTDTGGAVAGQVDQGSYNSADGALRQVDGARGLFRESLNGMMLASGIITDELMQFGPNPSAEDLRKLPEGATQKSLLGDDIYAQLQKLRVQSALAITGLRAYAVDEKDARAQAFAMQGYAEVMLAELFCSGIPLSMPPDGGDINYQPGSSRDSVFSEAAKWFDSTLSLTDSTPLLTLARVGKGRALVNLGRFAEAAQAVADVKDGDSYQLLAVIGAPNGGAFGGNFGGNVLDGAVNASDFGSFSASDGEGGTGLPYRSSGDPRTQSSPVSHTVDDGGVFTTFTGYYPAKYPGARGDSATFVVADWVEARLIEAEAALRASNTGATSTAWLDALNHLRSTAPLPAPLQDPAPVVLTPLTDPGVSLPAAAAAKARADTLFTERAAWLYLTGHRQGDLRRLIRQYGRTANAVYPAGPGYGTDINFPVPANERAFNTKFAGCIDRDA